MTTTSPVTRAAFNPLLRPYLVLYGAAMLAATIFLLPLAILWLCGIGQWWARHYFKKLECTLSDSALRYRKGIFVQIEKTIPLENIQDVTFIEGPLLRQFNLSILKFETAGHSAGQESDMKLVGVIDAEAMRRQILERRDKLRMRHQATLRHPEAEIEQLKLLKAILARLDDIANTLHHRAH